MAFWGYTRKSTLPGRISGIHAIPGRYAPRMIGNAGRKIGLPRNGTVAVIVVILVLSLMMAFTTSFHLMIQVEKGGGTSKHKQDRARFGAIAGINFVTGQLQATSSTFLSVTDYEKYRLYWASGTAAFGSAFTNVVPTRYYYVSNSPQLMDDEVASASLFKVVTYFDSTNLAKNYYVKSIGFYRDIELQNGNVVATYQAEFLARLIIATSTKSITLECFRPLEAEPCDAVTDTFFTTRPVIKP